MAPGIRLPNMLEKREDRSIPCTIGSFSSLLDVVAVAVVGDIVCDNVVVGGGGK